MRNSTIVVVLVILLAILAGWYWLGLPPMASHQVGQACTTEAMQCPDGTYVGRSGPNCAFVCPATAATTTATTTPPTPIPAPSGGQGILPYHSGIQGLVMAGPTCPVERMPPDPACADKPLQIRIAIYRQGSTQVFATAMSNAQGTFEVSLPPGSYTVQAGGAPTPPTCRPVPASVGPDAYTSVSVQCDTGIR